MSTIAQDVQLLFTGFLAKMFSNPTFAQQAVSDMPGTLQAEGIPESAVRYLDVHQAVNDACGYPGVPSSASSTMSDSGGGGGAPPQNYQELVQQLQVVNNFVTNEVIDNSSTVNIGANFGDLTIDNDVTQVGDNNEGAVGDNNEVANLDINAGGGAGGTAVGGSADAQGGLAATGATSADGGFGTGGEHGPGGPGGGIAANQASADAFGGTGGDASADGGDGGIVIPTIIFGDDVNEAGPGDQNIVDLPLARTDHVPVDRVFGSPGQDDDSQL